MAKPAILSEDIKPLLLEMLQAKLGEPVALKTFVKHLKIGAPAIRVMLQELGPTHNVRASSNSGRHFSFLIPTPDMLRQEQVAMERTNVRPFHPLRRRTDHAAAVERARASKLS
jgi:hypothetical protein